MSYIVKVKKGHEGGAAGARASPSGVGFNGVTPGYSIYLVLLQNAT